MRATLARSVVAAALLHALGSPAEAQTVFRPLSDFLSQQGTFAGSLFWPPVKNYLGWVNENGTQFGLMDYAGIANDYIVKASNGKMDLGTRVEGYVQEDRTTTGQGLVTVYLKTKNAMTFGCPAAKYPTLGFGYQAPEVLAGKPAALADCQLLIAFLTPSFGGQLPDLLQLLNAPVTGQQVMLLFFEGTAKGVFRGPSGYADGTPGTMYINQIALLFMNPGKWTIELVDVVPTTPIW